MVLTAELALEIRIHNALQVCEWVMEGNGLPEGTPPELQAAVLRLLSGDGDDVAKLIREHDGHASTLDNTLRSSPVPR